MKAQTTITKEEARGLLERYIYIHKGVLPIYDGNITINDERSNTISEYTFRYLIKIAYDLTDIKLTGL
jgi:hypothetical protein